MEWEVEYTDECEVSWLALSEDEQKDVNTKVIMLQRHGPTVRRLHSDIVKTSRHPNMKELIVQHQGRPYRILYAFDPRRCAILLLGGDKTGNDRWYEIYVPIADRLYDEHLKRLGREGFIDG